MKVCIKVILLIVVLAGPPLNSKEGTPGNSKSQTAQEYSLRPRAAVEKRRAASAISPQRPLKGEMKIPNGWLKSKRLTEASSKEEIRQTILEYLRTSPVGVSRFRMFIRLTHYEELNRVFGRPVRDPKNPNFNNWIFKQMDISDELYGRRQARAGLVKNVYEVFEEMTKGGILTEIPWYETRVLLTDKTILPDARWAQNVLSHKTHLRWLEQELWHFHGDTMQNIAGGIESHSAISILNLNREVNLDFSSFETAKSSILLAVNQVEQMAVLSKETRSEAASAKSLDEEIQNYLRVMRPLSDELKRVSGARIMETPPTPPLKDALAAI